MELEMKEKEAETVYIIFEKHFGSNSLGGGVQLILLSILPLLSPALLCPPLDLFRHPALRRLID